MENLGINILGSDEFCSDIAALFIKHIWNCQDCLVNVLAYFLAFYIAIKLVCLIFQFLSSLCVKLFDSAVYRKKYLGLEEELEVLQHEYDELADDYSVLADEFREFQTEFYHITN